jgi:hypothetical protein
VVAYFFWVLFCRYGAQECFKNLSQSFPLAGLFSSVHTLDSDSSIDILYKHYFQKP